MKMSSKNSFEVQVKQFMGGKSFDKLPRDQKQVIKEFSSFQQKTRAVYANGSLKDYEALGII